MRHDVTAMIPARNSKPFIQSPPVGFPEPHRVLFRPGGVMVEFKLGTRSARLQPAQAQLSASRLRTR